MTGGMTNKKKIYKKTFDAHIRHGGVRVSLALPNNQHNIQHMEHAHLLNLSSGSTLYYAISDGNAYTVYALRRQSPVPPLRGRRDRMRVP